MASSRLILRAVNSGFPTPFNDIVLGSVLSHTDLDNNQIYLKSEIIHTGTTSGTVVTFNKIGGKTIDVDLSSVISSADNYTTGTTLDNNILYFDRSDALSAYTADLSSIGGNGIYGGSGTLTTGTTVDVGTYNLIINDSVANTTFFKTVNDKSGEVLYLGTDPSDDFELPSTNQIYGMHLQAKRFKIFSISGGSVQHGGLLHLNGEGSAEGTLLGYNKGNVYSTINITPSQAAGRTGMHVKDEIHEKGFEYDDDYSSNYTNRSLVDKEYIDNAITGGGTFTGNTSGDCITDLYVSNIYGCSPVQFQSPIIIGDNPSLSADTFETSYIVGAGNIVSSTQIDTIYYENFDTGFDCGGCGPSITGGWYVSGTTGNQFDDSAQINGLDSTCNSCVASPSSGYFGASGGNGIELVDDPSLGMAFIALSGVSTVGYDTISVSWGAYNDDSGSGLGVAFEVSNDGGITWSGTTYTDTILGGPWELINGGIPIVLPSNMGEQTNTAYRWIFDTSSGNLDAYYIDDFNIYGDFTPSSTTINNLMIMGDNNHLSNSSVNNINIIGSNITATTNNQTYIENLTVTSAITFDNLTTGATEEFHLTLDSSNVVRKSDNIWARGTGSRSVLLGPKESIGSATASGPYSLSIGTSTDAIGLRSKAFGAATISAGQNATADGKRTYAAGDNSYAGGEGASTGEELIASGEASFAHFRYDTSPPVTNLRLGAYGDFSTILGGKNHNIGSGADSSAIFAGSGNTVSTGVTNSVILGGSNITGTTDDTVYVPNLNIQDTAIFSSAFTAGTLSNIFGGGVGSGMFQGTVTNAAGLAFSNSLDPGFLKGDLTGDYCVATLIESDGGENWGFDIEFTETGVGTFRPLKIHSVLSDGLATSIGTDSTRKTGVILNSHASKIVSGLTGTTIIGGGNISATTSNTVYVPNLNIGTIGTGTPVNNLAVDSGGNVVSGTTGGSTSKFSITTGFTGSVLKTITHGLATTDVITQVYDMNNNCQITPVICFNGSNDVDITISVTGTYKVVVIG